MGALTDWCYLVRGGEIYCYHCYGLNETVDGRQQQVVVTKGAYEVPLSVAYSWGSPV